MDNTRPRSSGGLLGHGSIYAFATVAPVLVALLITPAVTRQLGAVQYGVVGVGITLYQTGAILLGVGLSAAITRHAIIGGSGIAGAIALVYAGTAIAAVLALVALVAIRLWGDLMVPGGASESLVWPVVSAFGLAVLTLSQSVFRAQSRVVAFVILGVASAIIGPLVGLTIISLAASSASSYLVGLAVGHLATAIASLLILGIPRRAHLHTGELLASLRIGLPTVPHSVASMFLATVVVILASRLEGLEAAGRVQLAIFLGTAPILILGAFNNSWAPMIYRADDRARSKLLSQSSQVISVIVFVLIGGFSVLVDPVARFIAGPDLYSEDLTRFALIVSVATPFMALYLININEVFRTGMTGPLAFTTPSAAAIAVVLAFALRLSVLDSIIVFATVIPGFHLTMWLVSTWLRARTGSEQPRIAWSLPGLAVAAIAPIAVAILPIPLWSSAIIFLVIALLLAFAARTAISAVR